MSSIVTASGSWRWATSTPSEPARLSIVGQVRYTRRLGEVPEWSNGLAWKVSVRFIPYRGFESLPLRQNIYNVSLPEGWQSGRMHRS